jgi:hypothetical protein
MAFMTSMVFTDPTNSCKDVCEMTVVTIKAPVSCNDESSIYYDGRITMKALSFEADNSTECNIPSVHIIGQVCLKMLQISIVLLYATEISSNTNRHSLNTFVTDLCISAVCELSKSQTFAY